MFCGFFSGLSMGVFKEAKCVRNLKKEGEKGNFVERGGGVRKFNMINTFHDEHARHHDFISV